MPDPIIIIDDQPVSTGSAGSNPPLPPPAPPPSGGKSRQAAALTAYLRECGRLGGLAPGKNTAPALHSRLRNLGAEFDAAGHLVEGPATQRARKAMAAHARKARARQGYAASKEAE